MTKKWKQKWDDFVRSEFFRSKKCERFIIGLLIYTLTVGFGCIILGELTETGWLLIPGLFPGFIMIFYIGIIGRLTRDRCRSDLTAAWKAQRTSLHAARPGWKKISIARYTMIRCWAARCIGGIGIENTMPISRNCWW